MNSGYRELIYLLVIASGCGLLVFFLPEAATSITVYDTYLVIGKWHMWLLSTVPVAFLFFAIKQAMTGFESPMGNRLVVALGFATIPFLTIVSREAATLWAAERTQLPGYELIQQRIWQIQFAVVAYVVYIAYQWGNREK
ncbi:hypothetical protein [uncultured Fibrella sp.]|uniref:hypothetical protein n=1 Tax=uncultured Fibrella sp. TaxID=1284596 RepID=UPI0035CC2A37